VPAESASVESAAPPSTETATDVIPASAEPVIPAVEIEVPAPPAVPATE